MLLKGNVVMHDDEVLTPGTPSGNWEVRLVHWDIEPDEVTEADMLPTPPPLWPRVWPGL